MDLEGRFSGAESLAQVFFNLYKEHMTGVLSLTCDGLTTDFHFLLGRITGSGNPDRPRRLGQILLSRGLVDRAALEEALAYQGDFAPGTPLGKVLVHRERITQDNLREAIHLQLEEELWDVFSLPEGSYHFFLKDPQGAETPLVEQDPEPLVKEILTQRDEWEKIRERITDDSLIPAVVKLAGAADRETVHLNRKEWQILSLVNGYYDVGCIAARSGLGRFESFRILDVFISTGLMELRKPREPVQVRMDEESSPSQQQFASPREHGMSSSRWSGILSKLREPEDEEASVADKGRLQFDSPVAFVVAISNRIIDKLMTNPDFIVDPSDERLAERYWRQVLMSYPKADLVRANMNVLDAESFDRYTRSLGVQGPMKSIYLETMEALNRYLRTLHLLCGQRLGTKAAKSVFVTTMEDLRQRSTIGNSESFFFKEFAAKIFD